MDCLTPSTSLRASSCSCRNTAVAVKYDDSDAAGSSCLPRYASCTVVRIGSSSSGARAIALFAAWTRDIGWGSGVFEELLIGGDETGRGAGDDARQAANPSTTGIRRSITVLVPTDGNERSRTVANSVTLSLAAVG